MLLVPLLFFSSVRYGLSVAVVCIKVDAVIVLPPQLSVKSVDGH